MEPIISQFFLQNWHKKAIAIISAVVVWILVNQSITEVKTIPNIPIRVINLPADKTIMGLLPNNYLENRIALTLSGSKDVIQEIDPSDVEVLIDASTAENDDWIVQIGKKNLVSLNPALDLKHNIKQVSHSELIVKLTKLVNEIIPVIIRPPLGQAPEDYEFLDVWPEKLNQPLSGPKEEMQTLKSKGLKLAFDLNKITKLDLDQIAELNKHGNGDEISFIIPEKWKHVAIPFQRNAPLTITDPEAKYLRIDFLKKQLIPIERKIPITIFYPVKYSKEINPSTFKLMSNEQVKIENGIALLQEDLYVRDVSRLFLDIVRDNIEIVIIASPNEEREVLQWSLEVIDPREMEDTYVAYIISTRKGEGTETGNPQKREEVLRKRFQDYIKKLALYNSNNEKLNIVATWSGNGVIVRTVPFSGITN